MNTNGEHEQKLPPGWSKGYSKSQKRWYYSHAETKHTQWHFPTARKVVGRALISTTLTLFVSNANWIRRVIMRDTWEAKGLIVLYFCT